MPAVRNTPARRRMTCPKCQRDVSYTHPWTPDFVTRELVRDYDTRVLKDHTNPSTGGPCEVNGPNGLGLRVERTR